MRFTRRAVTIIFIVIVIIALLAFLSVYKGSPSVQCVNVPKPCGLESEDIGDRLILKWDTVPGATSYNLYIASDSNMVQNVQKIEDVSNPYILTKSGDSPSYIGVTSVFTAEGRDCESGFCDVVRVDISAPLLDAPILRCYDYFEFPEDGSFHVKTCGTVQSPTRLFIQWFPVQGAVDYVIYCNTGPSVSKTNFAKKWTVPGDRYYFESDVLSGNDCWSMIITSRNENGESLASKPYTTCVI